MSKNNFRISLSANVAKERTRFAIPTSVFTTICRSIPKKTEQNFSFFNLEHNVLMFVSYEFPNHFIFEEIKVLNLDSTGPFRNIETPEADEAFDPVFFKSYVDGRKVFLDKKITAKIKKMGIDTRELAFEDFRLKDGYYSAFLPNESHLVIDFHVYLGDIFVCDLLKPDYMKFGLFLYQS